MTLGTWSHLQDALAAIAEGDSVDPALADQLVELGLVDERQESYVATENGERYYMARFVANDGDASRETLGRALRQHPLASGLCEAIWALGGTVPKDGAVRLVKRLLTSGSERTAKRWLSLLNTAGLIAYNRANPDVRALWSPDRLLEEDGAGSHVITPSTPYQNLLSLREVLNGAREWLCWFEIHMPAKVLEVIHREIAATQVREVRLLSGPANVSRDLQGEFKRAREEWAQQRGIRAAWRVIPKKPVRDHHDRLFVSAAGAYNLPPINTILKGSTSEILPSNLTRDDFNEWWDDGEDLLALNIPEA